MDPKHSALHSSADRMGRIVNQQVNVFSIETAVNTQMYGGMLDFLQKNEDRFNDWDRLRLKGFRWTLGICRMTFAAMHCISMRHLWHDRGLGGRDRGGTSAGIGARIPAIRGTVKGQSDVLIVGVPYICPYNVTRL